MFPSRETLFVELADLIKAKTTKIVYDHQHAFDSYCYQFWLFTNRVTIISSLQKS